MEGQKAGREEGRKGGKKEWRTKGTKGGRKEWREERREGGQKAVGEKRRTEGRTEVRSKGCWRASQVGLHDFFVFHHHWRNWSDFAASLWLVFTPVHLHDCPNTHTLKQGHRTGDRHYYCADPHWQWRPMRAEESHHFIISGSIKLNMNIQLWWMSAHVSSCTMSTDHALLSSSSSSSSSSCSFTSYLVQYWHRCRQLEYLWIWTNKATTCYFCVCINKENELLLQSCGQVELSCGGMEAIRAAVWGHRFNSLDGLSGWGKTVSHTLTSLCNR